MFETVAPDASRRNKLAFYESLPLSLVIHALFLGVAGFLIINRLQFPIDPPRLLVAYAATELTPPPPPPPPPPPAASGTPTASTTATLPVNIAHVEELAPTIIPETVMELPPAQPRAQLASFTPGAPVAAAGGVPGGVDGGVAGGTVGGAKGGIIGGVLGDDGRLYLKKDAPLPLYAEFRPYPEYPEYQRSISLEDTVVVRYVIGKDGRVYDVQTTRKPKHKEFELSALEAIKQWRFRPLIVDGEPIEIVHEITVYFRLF